MIPIDVLTFTGNEISRDETSAVIKLTIDGLDYSDTGVDIEIKLAGNLQSKKGFAVFHGATLTYTAVEVFTGPFEDRKMIYFNAPGRGQSSPINNPDITKYSRIYSAVLHWLFKTGEIESLIILGYSMGGLIALRTASFNEVKIERIIMLSSTDRISSDNDVNQSIKDLADGKIDATNPECYNIVPMHGFSPGTPKEFIEMVAKAAESFLAPLDWAVTDMIKTYNTDFSGELEGLDPSIRFLFIAGEDDRVISPADSRATIEKLKKKGMNVESVFYKGAGHIDFLRLLADADGVKGMISHIGEFISG